jgi:TonB-linked SusC/RagA family outer membrane protein
MMKKLKLFLTTPKCRKRSTTIMLLLILCSFSLVAQEKKTISGKITDELGESLPGVNIIEKNTQNGTSTDFDGNYKISVTKGATLMFSYLGYKTTEITVGNQTKLDVQLKPDLSKLEEVVVIGYGSVQRKDLTGSVASVKMDKLTEAPVTNFDQALAGRISGVQVTTASGEPGSQATIRIRGNNSITGGNDPLYVVDEFIMEGFNPGLIDPSDIESINVLKDASATAIYGVRGANGVIIITTKRAKIGKTKISFETRFDIKEVSKKLPMLNAYEFIKLGLELNESSTELRFFSKYDEEKEQNVIVGKLEDYKNEPSKNWQDEAFRTAFSKTHKLKISSGTEKTKFNASLNNISDEGNLLGSKYNRTNGRITLNHKVDDKLDATVDVLYTNYVQRGIKTNGNSSYSFLRSLIGYAPVANKYRDYGDFDPLDDVSDEYDLTNIVVWHPIVSLKNEYRKSETDQFISNLGLNYKITPNLIFQTKGSYNTSFIEAGAFNNSKTVYGRLINKVNGINGTSDKRRYKNFSNVNTLTYKKKFNNHYINAVVGTTFTLREKSRTRYTAIEIPKHLEHLGMNSLDGGELLDANDISSSEESKIFSVLGRINYTFKDKYLFTATLRRDASSNFVKKNRVGYFPSAAFSWNAQNEAFIKQLNTFSQLKFRVGYGETGNDRVRTDARFDLLTDQDSSYPTDNSPQPGVRPTDHAGNPDLTWEITEQLNVGIDLGFWDGRINITADVYQKDTKNLILDADKAPSEGYLTQTRNIGHMRNKGFEFSLSTVNIKTDNFSWTSDFNISFNQNTVEELPEGKPLFGKPNYYWRYSTDQFIVQEGEALGNMYGYVSDGVYQPADFENYDANASSHTLMAGQASYKTAHQPGDEKFKDLNGDGKITAADKTVIGNGLPKHHGGFTNTFTYKNFELSAFLQWNYGNDILNANKLVFESMTGAGQNQLATVLNRWTPENQNTTMHRAGGQGFEDVSSRIVEDGSFLRLKTVNLSYKFNANFLQKLNLESLKLFVSAQNLVTWTNYSGFDPEVSVYNRGITPSIDYSSYPKNKTISFGLNLSF